MVRPCCLSIVISNDLAPENGLLSDRAIVHVAIRIMAAHTGMIHLVIRGQESRLGPYHQWP